MLDFLQSREELLSTPSLLAEALEVLATDTVVSPCQTEHQALV
jgi:hypothetical protein